MVEKKGFNSDGVLLSNYLYQYDEEGRRIKGNGSDSTIFGKAIMDFSYKYDNKGRRIEYDFYYSCENLIVRSITKYNEKGNEIEKIDCDINLKIEERMSYIYTEYDKTGNWIKKSELKNQAPISVTEREIVYY